MYKLLATDGKCVGVDYAIFFPLTEEEERAAKAICNDCKLKSRCLDFAITNHMVGIMGGTNEAERGHYIEPEKLIVISRQPARLLGGTQSRHEPVTHEYFVNPEPDKKIG